jgi:hypothetical protein
MSQDPSPSDVSFVGDDDSSYFRTVHGRSLNTLNTTYLLPVDQDEIKVRRNPSVSKSCPISLFIQRFQLHHRMLQYVFHGKNYLGPVKRILQFGEQRRGAILVLSFVRLECDNLGLWSLPVLDLGTGAGHW